MSEQCRDWISSLWQASYMGVQFYFESDDESFGRAIKVHEFPGRDDPFIEDLGRKTKVFEGAAYVTGDDADTHAIALGAAFDDVGPGILVLPILGPVSVHCEDAKRHSDKNKFGYIAFSVKFVRDGEASAVSSVPLLGQRVFDQADVLSQSVAALFPNALQLATTADYVIAAAVDTVQGFCAAMTILSASNAVDPATATAFATAVDAINHAAPLLIVPADAADPGDVAVLLDASPTLDHVEVDPIANLAAVMVATVRLLGDGMTSNDDAGAGALLSLAMSFPALSPSPALSVNAADAAKNSAAIAGLVRLAALIAWCEALERQTYASRPDGIAARAAAAERLGLELANWPGGANAAVYGALCDLQGAVVEFLTALIINLAPIVTVSAPQSMPSLWWAYQLYGDPGRAVDLVMRNQERHPSFMPLTFQALAPDFAAPPSLPTAWPAP